MSTQIQEITNKVDRVEDVLQSRLAEQHKVTLARVYGWKWLLSTIYKKGAEREMLDANVLKKIRIEVGQYWYRCAEQAEILTMALCLLDNVQSAGQSAVRAARKAQVLRIQSMLEYADCIKSRAEKLKGTCESFIAPLIEEYQSQPESVTTDEEDEDSCSSEPECENSGAEKESSAADCDNDMAVDEKNEEDLEPEEQNVQEHEPEELMQEEREPEEKMQESQEDTAKNDYSHLPIWRPKYEAIREADGVYLRVNVSGVKPDNIDVQLSRDTGTVQVSGVKLPSSNREVYVTKMTGNATYGRFVVSQQFRNPSSLNFDDISYELTHGNRVLQVFIPYRVVRSRQQHPVNYFNSARAPRYHHHSAPVQHPYYSRPSGSTCRRQSYSPFGLVW